MPAIRDLKGRTADDDHFADGQGLSSSRKGPRVGGVHEEIIPVADDVAPGAVTRAIAKPPVVSLEDAPRTRDVLEAIAASTDRVRAALDDLAAHLQTLRTSVAADLDKRRVVQQLADIVATMSEGDAS